MEKLENKINKAIKLIQCFSSKANELSNEGFYLGFSGGKDSVVIYTLAKMSGAKFQSYFNPTTIDPPEVIRFIKKDYPDVRFTKVRTNIYELSKKKKMLPASFMRFCCTEFKENKGKNVIKILGVRAEESSRRKNLWNIINTRTSKIEDRKKWYSYEDYIKDNDSSNNIILNPILDWNEGDVWDFIEKYTVKYCKLYDEGYSRIGCIGCPLSTKRAMEVDFEKYPYVKKKWMDVIEYILQNNNRRQFNSAEEYFEWWISKEGLKTFKEKQKQTRLNFDER